MGQELSCTSRGKLPSFEEGQAVLSGDRLGVVSEVFLDGSVLVIFPYGREELYRPRDLGHLHVAGTSAARTSSSSPQISYAKVAGAAAAAAAQAAADAGHPSEAAAAAGEAAGAAAAQGASADSAATAGASAGAAAAAKCAQSKLRAEVEALRAANALRDAALARREQPAAPAAASVGEHGPAEWHSASSSPAQPGGAAAKLRAEVAAPQAQRRAIRALEEAGAAGPVAPAAPEWEQVFDEGTGKAYYWNRATNEVTWTAPVALSDGRNGVLVREN